MHKNALTYFGIVFSWPVFGQISLYLLVIIQLCFEFFFTYEYYLINMLLLLATFSMQKCKYVENKT